MSRLKQAIHEIHRRSLWQVLLVYLGVSWGILEAVALFRDEFGLPDWLFSGAFVLVLAGFPIVVLTALVHPSDASDPTGQAPGDKPARLSARKVLTWRRVLLGGALAMALLAAVASGYTAMRVLGIGPAGSLIGKGVLEERERIVLADFENLTDDSLLSLTLTEAFRVDIAQSPVVSVADRVYLAAVLERMEREPESVLDFRLAREVAIREGWPAVIAGEIGAVGGSYLLSVRLVAAESGAELASLKETADEENELLSAIERLSRKMRARIGESLVTVRANEPLAAVTTSSLDALYLYSRAIRALEVEGDIETGVALLEEALAFDSTFAMAWRRLGLRTASRSGRIDAFTRAFELRHRLTDRERYITMGTYYWEVTYEREKAIAAFRALLDVYPDDYDGLNSLAYLYELQEDNQRVLELTKRQVELYPNRFSGYGTMAAAQVALGQWAEAELTLDAGAEALPGTNPQIEGLRALLAWARGDYEAAQVLAASTLVEGGSVWRAAGNYLMAAIALSRGQLAAAERHVIDAVAIDEEQGVPFAGLIATLHSARIDLVYRGDPTGAVHRLDEALERFPLDDTNRPDRPPYLDLAVLYAWAGEADRSKELVGMWEAEVDPRIQRRVSFRHAVSGRIAMAEGRFEEAIEAYRAWERDMGCSLCALSWLADAYERVGVSDSALAMYERYVTTPWMWRINNDRWQSFNNDKWQLGVAYERLSQLYEARGDADNAVLYYGHLVELWKDADPELQPRVEAARRAIETLSPDG
jgi:tetratricopeptide (TPR) repeat protein